MLIDNSEHKYYIEKAGIGTILQSLIEYIDDQDYYMEESWQSKFIDSLENAYDIYMKKHYIQC